MIPKIDRDDFKTEVDVLWDHKVVAESRLGLATSPSRHAFLPAPASIELESVYVGPAFAAGDGRPSGLDCRFAGFEPVSSDSSIGPDIVSDGAAIHVGSGWRSLEAHGRISPG